MKGMSWEEWIKAKDRHDRPDNVLEREAILAAARREALYAFRKAQLPFRLI